jgi:peptidoglycan LD-endopeptidase CwlK
MIDNDLSHLYPPYAEQVQGFLYKVNAEGLPAHVFEGFRSMERQLELYAKGRVCKDGKWVIIHPELIVTKAFPGFGLHSYGVAIDMAFDGNHQRAGVQWTWDDGDARAQGKQPLPWTRLGQIGELFGMEWAGRWTTFPELPHFQNRFGLQVHQMYDIYQADGLQGVWKAFDKRAWKAAA